MTDEQALYLTLVVLYIIESAAWVPRGAAAFVAKNAKNENTSRLAFPRRGLSNNRGGVVLGDLRPGAVGTFVVPQWPVSMAKEGVLGWVAESLELSERAFQSGLYRRLNEKDAARADGRDVRVGGEALVTAPSNAMASRVAGVIERVRAASPKKRPEAIEAAMGEMFDVASARARCVEFWAETKVLGAASLALAIVAFVGSPAAVIAVGIELSWPFVLGGVYLATWVVAFLFFRAHRRLMPSSRWERVGQVILLVLLPLSAMRASDGIARTLLHGFHPLAVAAALAPRDAFARLAAHLLRDAANPRHPACLSDDPEVQGVEAWYRGALRRHIEALITREGLAAAAMLAPPARGEDEEGALRYCPRCLSKYGEDTETCEDCGGVPVVALPEAPKSS